MDAATHPRPGGVTPYLIVRAASDAIEFYREAFGAEEIMRVDAGDGQRLMHCHLRINGDDVFMSDEFPEHGAAMDRGPAGVTLHLGVEDADMWWDRALAAGAEPVMPLADQFWGDRYGQVRDPYGHTWSIAAPIRP